MDFSEVIEPIQRLFEVRRNDLIWPGVCICVVCCFSNQVKLFHPNRRILELWSDHLMTSLNPLFWMLFGFWYMMMHSNVIHSYNSLLKLFKWFCGTCFSWLSYFILLCAISWILRIPSDIRPFWTLRQRSPDTAIATFKFSSPIWYGGKWWCC